MLIKKTSLLVAFIVLVSLLSCDIPRTEIVDRINVGNFVSITRGGGTNLIVNTTTHSFTVRVSIVRFEVGEPLYIAKYKSSQGCCIDYMLFSKSGEYHVNWLRDRGEE